MIQHPLLWPIASGSRSLECFFFFFTCLGFTVWQLTPLVLPFPGCLAAASVIQCLDLNSTQCVVSVPSAAIIYVCLPYFCILQAFFVLNPSLCLSGPESLTKTHRKTIKIGLSAHCYQCSATPLPVMQHEARGGICSRQFETQHLLCAHWERGYLD